MPEVIFISSIVLIAYTYLLYPAILYIFSHMIRRTKTPKQHDMEAIPNVSLIIAAHNEEKVIRDKIENCLQLDYPEDKFEIIIASDGSTDRTNEIAARYTSQLVKLMAYANRRGKISALNETVPKAKGDIIVFSDATTMYEKPAIRELVERFSDPEVGCVVGDLRYFQSDSTDAGEGMYWKYERLLRSLEGDMGFLFTISGAICAIRKSLYPTIPGGTILDDFVMAMKILEQGYKVVYEPKAVAYDESPQTMVETSTRRIRIATGHWQGFLLTKKLLNPIMGIRSLAYWSHKGLRYLVPFLLLLIFISNLALIGNLIYRLIFISQILFYCAAAIGYLLTRRVKVPGIIRAAVFFSSMNLCLLIGLYRALSRRQGVLWTQVGR